MSCEHADSCVVCLRAELGKVRAERDTLLATLEQLVGLRQAVLQKELNRPQGEPQQALTPPDRPAKRKPVTARPPLDGSMLEEMIATAEGKRGQEKRDQLMEGTFGVKYEKLQEDLAERAGNLDPTDPRHSAPRPAPVEEGRFDAPKPTAPYENQWKKAMEYVDAGQIAMGIMAEGVQQRVGQELVEAFQQEQPAPAKQPKMPARGRSKQPKKGPAGRQRKASPARGSVKEVKRF